MDKKSAVNSARADHSVLQAKNKYKIVPCSDYNQQEEQFSQDISPGFHEIPIQRLNIDHTFQEAISQNQNRIRKKRSQTQININTYYGSNYGSIQSEIGEQVRQTINQSSTDQILRGANIEEAMKHRKASLLKAGLGDSKTLCECCGASVTGTQIPLQEKIQNLASLGPSFPLFFYVTFYLIAIMATMLVSNILVFILYMIYLDQVEQITFLNMFAPGLSGGPCNDCFFASFFTVTNGFLLYIILQRKLIWMSVKYSIQSDDISNYSLIFYNASQDLSEDDIKQNFQVVCDQIKVTSVTFSYEARKIFQVLKKYKQTQKRLLKLKNKGEKIEEVQQKLIELKAVLTQQIQSVDNQKRNKIAFITFQNKYMATRIYNLLQLSFYQKLQYQCFRNYDYKVSKSSSPQQIFWENLSLTSNQKNKMKLLNYFISIIGLAVFTYCIYLFRVQDDLRTVQIVVQIQISSLIILLELAFVQIVYWQSYQEKYISLVFYKISVSIKLAVLLSFSTGVMWLVIGLSEQSESWLGFQGYTGQIILVLTMNAILVPLYQLQPFNQLITQVRICLLKRKAKKNIIMKPQAEINKLFEYPDIQLEEKYSFLIKTFFVTVLFMITLPIGLLISILGLWFYSKIFKIKLLRFSKTPKYTSEDLGLNMFSLVKFGFILYGISTSFIYQQFDLGSLESWGVLIYPIFLVMVLYIPFVHNYFFKFNLQKLKSVYEMNEKGGLLWKQEEETDKPTYRNRNPVLSLQERVSRRGTEPDMANFILDELMKYNERARGLFLHKRTFTERSDMKHLSDITNNRKEREEFLARFKI